MDYVYRQYPWFTVNSKRQQNAARPVAALAVYTAGYEGQQVDAFLNMLMRNGIQQLLDVRNNPVSRRYGFHKTTLGRLCKSLDIEYVHRPNSASRPRCGKALRRRRITTRSLGEYEAEVSEGPG